MTPLAQARECMIEAEDDYIAEQIELHGKNGATMREALNRIHELYNASRDVVRVCRANKADPMDNDRAALMVDWMMDGQSDEKLMIGLMCQVADLEAE